MSQFFDYTGVVEEVLPVQTFSSGFTKRDVIVGNDVDSPSKYPNPVKFTFKKDNCSLLGEIIIKRKLVRFRKVSKQS